MEPLLEINSIYYDPSHPAGFGSIDKLAKAMKGKMRRDDVKDWLQSQETYTLHKPVQRIFFRNKYVLSNYNVLWQADLSDLRSYSKYYDGYNSLLRVHSNLLCVIDVFSKYAYVRAIKNKNSENIKHCFESIFAEANEHPHI